MVVYMLSEKINVEMFQREFRKKFDNFCRKAPLLMTYTLSEESISIFEELDSKRRLLFKYEFNFEVTVKENIKRIKDILLSQVYPILIQTETIDESYTSEELNQMVQNKEITLDEAPNIRKKTTNNITWRIERVIVPRDELFIRNLLTNKIYRYRMKYPVTIFLKKLRNNLTPEKGWSMFFLKSELLNEIYENYSDSE
jgi:hypothetical protein